MVLFSGGLAINNSSTTTAATVTVGGGGVGVGVATAAVPDVSRDSEVDSRISGRIIILTTIIMTG